MAMIVQHNLTAMNSNRQLGVTTNAQAKSSEKLSSGYRINRAGDDAAGLKISEKMRSQVRGLNRASTNAQDGVSLIQTAEGALNEAHSILQRMNELAVQGANDTNENIDREAINEELDQLTQELDRISTTTQFNKQNLLDGTFQNKNLHVGANANQKIQITIDNMNAETLGLRSIKGEQLGKVQTGEKPSTVTYKGNTYAYDVKKTQAENQAAAISVFGAAISRAADEDQYAMQLDKTTGSTYFIGNKKSTWTASAKVPVTSTNAAGSAVAKMSTKAAPAMSTNASGDPVAKMSTTVVLGKMSTQAASVGTPGAGSTVAFSVMSTKAAPVMSATAAPKMSTQQTQMSGFTRYAAASAAMKADISIAKAAMSGAIMSNFANYLQTTNTAADDVTVAAPTSAFNMAKPGVDSYAKANATIQAVQEAINKVSSQRSALGAIQNRLEHTIANLDNVAENTQAAESRIRDLDMAAEMVEYSKNNILAQAGQSMLAQANQSTQGVLSLLG